ncbi:hypothetical protein G6W42_08060 [Campylobacter concisus]|uniref:hypothetical protein n=1 Tax=Campylobacter concisus TaxID=199 RepID=UPI001883BE36|nr:hypothetical protein [Campylobacter concisus]MBE9852568.1 hypothetical protein [Campylobacter concisus]
MDKNLIDLGKSLSAIQTFSEMITEISVMDGVFQRRELIENLADNIRVQVGEAKESMEAIISNNDRQANDKLSRKNSREIDDERR